MAYNYALEDKLTRELEENKKKKAQNADSRSRTVAMNRARAAQDTNYAPAGVSRTTWDAIREGTYHSSEKPKKDNKSVYQAVMDGSYTDRRMKAAQVKSTMSTSLPSPLPSVNSGTEKPKKTFAQDVEERKRRYASKPKTQTLFGTKAATGLDLMKAKVDESTPVNYDTVIAQSERTMADLSKKISKAQDSVLPEAVYPLSQRRADLEKYSRLYQQEEAFLKQIKEERMQKGTYESAAGNEDFSTYSRLGARKSNPAYEDTFGKVLLGNKQFGTAPINNKVEYAFASKDFLLPDTTYAARTLHGTDAKYLTMTDEERALYNYFLGKGYTTAAEDYLNSMDGELTQRLGKVLADRTANDANAARRAANTVITAGNAGFESGVAGIGQAADRVFALNDAPHPLSAAQQTYRQLRPQVGGALGMTADLVNSAGNMVPSLAAGALAGPGAGAATMGASSAGNAYADARREGKTDAESGKYALFEGGKEALMSYLLGGISKLGKAGASTALSKIPALNKAAQAVGKAADKLKVNPTVRAALRASGKYGANMADEGLEEYIQEILEPVARNLAFGETNEFKLFSPEALYAGALGAITAGVMNAPEIPGRYRAEKNKTNQKLSSDMNELLVKDSTLDTADVKPADTTLQPLPEVKAKDAHAAGVFDSEVGTKANIAEQETVEQYIDYAYRYAEEQNVKQNKSFPKQKEKIVIGKTSDRLVSDIKNTYGMDITNAYHVLKDNDIRHIKNSHGEGTNEKYPVTAADLKQIPDIVKNYDDVLFTSRPDGKRGLYFVKRHNGTTYYLEALRDNGRVLQNKQMIKVQTGTIPDIKELREAINKKWNMNHSPDDASIPRMYVQDVPNHVPANTIPQPLPEVKADYSQGLATDTTADSLLGWTNDQIREQNRAYAKQAEASQNFTILTETPKHKKEPEQWLRELKSETRRKYLDAGDTVREVGKASGDTHLYAYYNNAKQAQAAGQYMVTKAQTDLAGNRIGKSLDDIFAPIKEKGAEYEKAFGEFMTHRHNIDRVKRDAPINFSEDFTLEKSQETVKNLLREHPEFADLAEDVYTFSRNLLQYKVDAGLIRKDFMDMLNRWYPHYVPTHRDIDSSYFPIDTLSEEVARIGTGTQKAHGSNENILPLYDQLSKMAVQTTSQAKRNLFAQRLAQIVYNDPMAMSHFAGVPKDADGLFDIDSLKGDMMRENILVFHRNGKTQTMEIGAPLMDAVRDLINPGGEHEKITSGLRSLNQAYKSLITEYNPVFTVKNIARDIPDALFASKNSLAFARYFPEAVREMATGGEMWQKFEAMGGTASSLFDYDYNSGTFSKQNKLKKNTIGRISEANRFLEMVPRFAEFYATVKKGDGSYSNLMDAMHNAADITVNFQRSGTKVKTPNATWAPFLNASLQGLDKNIRIFTEGGNTAKAWARIIFKAAIIGLAPSVLNEFILGEDEQYKELNEHKKLNNYVIKTGDNQFITIPKGRLTGVIGSLGAAGLRAIRGGEVDAGALVLNALNQVGPMNPLENNLISPFINTINNKTWYGGEIENDRLRALPVTERYDSRTSEIGKWTSKAIGGAFGLSPKKIDALIDSYTGVIGDTILPLFTNPEGKSVNAEDRIAGGAYKAFVAPWEKAFTVNGNVSNNVSSKFYDKRDELSQKAAGQNATMADGVVVKYFNSKNDELSSLYNKLRATESMTHISAFDKKERTERIQMQINEIQRDMLAKADTYKVAAEMYDNEEKETAYLLTNRDVFGAEYALKEAGKDVYEQAQKAVGNGASFENYVEYIRKVWALPQEVKQDSERYLDAKGNIIRGINWADKERYILSVMSESKQKKYNKVKAQFGNIGAVEYHKIIEGYNKAEGKKDKNGKTITGTKKASQLNYLQSIGFNYQGAVLFRKILESN